MACSARQGAQGGIWLHLLLGLGVVGMELSSPVGGTGRGHSSGGGWGLRLHTWEEHLAERAGQRWAGSHQDSRLRTLTDWP